MLLQLKKMHNQKKMSCFCQRHYYTEASGFTVNRISRISIINKPCCSSIEIWASSANWTFCICWVCFLIFCFRSFSSSFRSSCSLSENLSQSHWIVEWIQVKYHLFLCAFTFHFFLHFFKSKVYLSLTDLVVTFKFISSREFSTIAISSYNCPRLTLPC